MNVLAPGSALEKLTVVTPRNVLLPGLPEPSVRSSAMSYDVTSSSVARSRASDCARLRVPVTASLLSSTGLRRMVLGGGRALVAGRVVRTASIERPAGKRGSRTVGCRVNQHAK
jgi:hypothetical protein